MGPAGEKARFGGRGPIFGAEDARDVEFLRAEEFPEAVAGLVFADGGNGDDLGTEGGEIAGGVGSTARGDLGFTMFEDEDGGFAGNAGDIADLERVRNEIAQHDDGFGRETFHVVGEGEQVDRGGGALGQ